MILAECRRYDEALDDLRAVDFRTAPGSDDYALNKQAIASLLARTGRPHEAIAELDSALIVREGLHHEVIGGLLVTYAEIAAEAGVEVPCAYSDDAARAIHAWGLSADSELLSCSLRDALLHAESLMAQAQKRYNALRRAARNKPGEIATVMVKEYINEEPVGQYRERAMRFLESLMRQPGAQS
jgi:tetratricopeptide (TPR) repeat protein